MTGETSLPDVWRYTDPGFVKWCNTEAEAQRHVEKFGGTYARYAAIAAQPHACTKFLWDYQNHGTTLRCAECGRVAEPAIAAQPERARAPVAWLYRGEKQSLTEKGVCLVYAEKQRFAISPHEDGEPLYAAPVALPDPEPQRFIMGGMPDEDYRP